MVFAESSGQQRAFPWVTLGLVLLAGVALASGDFSTGLIYERARISGGEFWRLWTGHLIHFGFSHFLWNMAVVVTAGSWCERVWPQWTRWFYTICPLAISLALFVFDQALERYAGLSGVATGLIVLLSGLQLSRPGIDSSWLWLGVLALVAAKLGLEIFIHKPLFVGGLADVRTVPLAHGVGAICGGVLAGVKGVRNRRVRRRG